MAQAGAQVETLRNAFTLPPALHEEERWQDSSTRSTTTWTTPGAVAVVHE